MSNLLLVIGGMVLGFVLTVGCACLFAAGLDIDGPPEPWGGASGREDSAA